MSFAELGLSDKVLTAVSAAGYTTPTPIQAQAIPHVLARKDVPTSYHLAVTVDDALQGVTHVVRGRDLEAATDVHVLLQNLLGLPTPLYHFHRLLLGDDGQKLAKSRDSQSLAALRDGGTSAEEIRQRLGFA